MLSQPLCKARHFVRHFTCGAVEPNGQPNYNPFCFVLAGNLAQPLQVFGAILSHQHRQRRRGDPQLIGKREADAFAAVIERKNPSAGRGSHLFNYTATDFAIFFVGLSLCQRFHSNSTRGRVDLCGYAPV